MAAIWHIVLLGVASNLDNLGVGIAYGARRTHVPWTSNTIVAAVAFGLSIVGAWAGAHGSRLLSETAARSLGAAILIVVGLLTLRQQPEQADRDKSGSISAVEAVWLGVSLGVNCLTNGFAGGLWDLGAVAVAGSNALFSYIAMGLGTWLGKRYADSRLGARASIAAACLLILLGLRQLI